MSDPLPISVRQRLEEYIRGANVAQGDLAAGATSLSQKYRRLGGKNLQMESMAEACAYVATRLPATYAAVMQVLRNIHSAVPDFVPTHSLDIGAGPATATLAMNQMFSSLQSNILLEPNPFLRRIGENLLDKNVAWHSESLQKYQSADKADMVIASYVFNELPEAETLAAVQKYWEQCAGVMVIVEPGTPQGASVIAKIRTLMADKNNAYLLGPCPQAGECPLDGVHRWCHFSTRVERSRLHKQLKEADVGYEDEKFAWVAFARFPVSVPNHRLIGHPSGTKLRELQVCNAAGDAVTLKIAKSNPLYKTIRKLEWGDGFDG